MSRVEGESFSPDAILGCGWNKSGKKIVGLYAVVRSPWTRIKTSVSHVDFMEHTGPHRWVGIVMIRKPHYSKVPMMFTTSLWGLV